MIVLNYHELTEDAPSNPWCIPKELFDAHLAEVADRLIAPSEFLARCDDPRHARSDEVLLTFDDCCLSDYTYAFPRFAGADGPGFMSFVPIEHVGRPEHLTWEMIEEMCRHGVTIGSHGVAHSDLTKLATSDVVREFRLSKDVLEDRLGQAVTLFAFPYGRFSLRLAREALKAGYKRLFTIQLGYHSGFEPYLVSRFCVTNQVDQPALARYLHNPDSGRGRAYNLANRLGLYKTLMRMRFR